MSCDMCYYDVVVYALIVRIVCIVIAFLNAFLGKTLTAIPFGSSSFTANESGTFA